MGHWNRTSSSAASAPCRGCRWMGTMSRRPRMWDNALGSTLVEQRFDEQFLVVEVP
jgi:hypothetical protein